MLVRSIFCIEHLVLGDTLISFRPLFKSSQEGRREIKGGFKNRTKKVQSA